MEHKRVLVIDDEEVVLDSISRILTEEGFEVHTSLKGGSGISHAINESYNLILTDIRMPDIDGLKVIRDIKRFRPSVPIVIITGYATITSAVQAMHLGAANYIEKPFTPEQLVETVTSAMEDAPDEPVEAQTLVHRKEMRKVLKKGASDKDFVQRIFRNGADALAKYRLTDHEKLAVITGDVNWIADQLGALGEDQKRWLLELAIK